MKIVNKIAGLIDVKSITTLLLVVAFVVLSISGVIAADQFLQVFLVIITYYFTKQSSNEKNEDTGQN